MPAHQTLFERISALAGSGPLSIPIWCAFLFCLVAFLRGPLLALFFRTFRIGDPALLESTKKRLNSPLQLLFLTLALLPFTSFIVPPFGSSVVFCFKVLAAFLAFHIAIQAVDLSIFSWYLKRTRANVSAVMRFFTLAALYAIAVMLLIEWEAGVSVLPLLATSTVLTAVLGLALQDTLKNAFAGLNMSLENSFEQGDWVLFRYDQTQQWVGQIVEIGWRTTKIRTLNNNYAVIPNSTFTANELINFNRPSSLHARTVEIPVMLNSDPEKVGPSLEESAMSVAGVLSEPRAEAIVTQIGTDRATWQLRFWLNQIEKRDEITGNVLARCWSTLKDLGALY